MAEEWPVPAFYFTVVINSDTSDSSFQEVSGIESQIETEEYREGGSNLVYYLPKSIKHSNLSLKRGIAGSNSTLFLWCQELMESELAELITPKNISVRLLDANGNPCRIWNFDNAYPVKWKVDSFNSTKNDVAIEEIEFCYSRCVREEYLPCP